MNDVNYNNVEQRYLAQIEAEDRLISERMNWMLQFNGFLIAAFGVAIGTSEDTQQLESFLLGISVVGLLVTLFGLAGVFAAQHAADTKRAAWLSWLQSNAPSSTLISSKTPLFQSTKISWVAGALNCFGIPIVMATFWLWLLLLSPY